MVYNTKILSSFSKTRKNTVKLCSHQYISLQQVTLLSLFVFSESKPRLWICLLFHFLQSQTELISLRHCSTCAGLFVGRAAGQTRFLQLLFIVQDQLDSLHTVDAAAALRHQLSLNAHNTTFISNIYSEGMLYQTITVCVCLHIPAGGRECWWCVWETSSGLWSFLGELVSSPGSRAGASWVGRSLT